jgi:hypothetical protein
MWDYLNKIPESWRYGIIILMIVLIIVLLAKWVNTRQTCSADMVRQIRHLLSEASRWQAICQQDQNGAYALMHANYAVAYSNVARLLMSDEHIRNATGVNMQEFAMQLNDTQQKCMQALSQICPAVQPDNQYAMAIGWIG